MDNALNRCVNEETEKLIEATKSAGRDCFLWYQAVEAYAKGYVKSMCKNALVSDNCLLNSIGYRWAKESLKSYMTHWGFDVSNTDDKFLFDSFRNDVFKCRNPEKWKHLAFALSGSDIDKYEENLKDGGFVTKCKDAQKALDNA